MLKSLAGAILAGLFLLQDRAEGAALYSSSDWYFRDLSV
jgi:hypothetical protein